MSVEVLSKELEEAADRLASCRNRLAAMSDTLDRCGLPRPTHTCIGKGGAYEHLGVALGAGKSRGHAVEVYRDVVTGSLFFRDSEDFAERMAPIGETSA